MDSEKTTRFGNAIAAGVAYFAGVFALAFLLGILRRIALVPWIGEVGAVLIEVPILLVFSWVVARRLVARKPIPARWRERAVMGVTGFGCLLLAEYGLAVAGFALSLSSFIASFLTPAGLIGLVGQILFGAMPVLLLVSDTAASRD